MTARKIPDFHFIEINGIAQRHIRIIWSIHVRSEHMHVVAPGREGLAESVDRIDWSAVSISREIGWDDVEDAHEWGSPVQTR